MIDADHFKAYNDSFGHQKGDDLLRSVALCIAAHVHRPEDLVARYGGEEFVVLLPRTDRLGAIDVAEMLRLAVMKLAAAHPKTPAKIVTVSIGAASAWPDQASGSDRLVAQADAALYQAKLAGRNCCRVALEFEANSNAA